MKASRTSLLVATAAPVVLVGAGGYFLVAGSSQGAALSRLALDGGLLIFVVAAVVALTQGPEKLVRELAAAIRGLSIGQKQRRLDAERFGELSEAARAFNELAASMCEQDDPNLGEVKSRKRGPAPPPRPSAGRGLVKDRRPDEGKLDDGLSEHPELGPVRKIAKKAAPATSEARSDEGPPADNAEPADPTDGGSRPPSRVEASLHEAETVVPEGGAVPGDSPVATSGAPVASASDDVDSDGSGPPAAASDEGATVRSQPPVESLRPSPGADTAVDEVEPQPTVPDAVPPFRDLFDEFLKLKQENGEATEDIEFGAFAETLREEGERLKSEHRCRDVRFEVRMQGGEVSLQPRLLR